MTRRKAITLGFALVAAVGAGWLAWPTVDDRWQGWRAHRLYDKIQLGMSWQEVNAILGDYASVFDHKTLLIAWYTFGNYMITIYFDAPCSGQDPEHDVIMGPVTVSDKNISRR